MNWLNKLQHMNILDYHAALKKKTINHNKRIRKHYVQNITQNNEQGAECYHLCRKEGKEENILCCLCMHNVSLETHTKNQS